MITMKITAVVILVATLAFAPSFDAQSRRRRRSCTPRNCQVSHWSSWNPCSTNQCGQQGSQSRSRTVVSSPGCGGAQCPNLHETQQCNGSTPINCQVSLWSLWSGCSADKCGQQGTQNRSRTVASSKNCGGAQCPDLHEARHCNGIAPVSCKLSAWSDWSTSSTACGASGTQTRSCHEKISEQCGGTCTSNFSITRSCPQISCLNGGSLKDGKCFCKEGYSGSCCEHHGKKRFSIKQSFVESKSSKFNFTLLSRSYEVIKGVGFYNFGAASVGEYNRVI